MELAEASEALILHFGEMGSRWGFNRTVGQIYGLLMVHEEPLNADQIGALLRVSRGNVSMGLKELQSWRLIILQHRAGDRKDYFTVAGDFWDMAKTVFEERRKRELEPTLSLLRTHLLNEPASDEEAYAQQKMHELHDFLELLDQWSTSLNTLNPDALKALMKLGSGVSKFLNLKSKAKRK